MTNLPSPTPRRRRPSASLPARVGPRAVVRSAEPLRALDVFDHLPPGCLALPVDDDGCVPHLQPGELAILDPADTWPMDGELYALRRASGRVVIVQARRAEAVIHGMGEEAVECWWTNTAMARARDADEAVDMLVADAIRLSDGPMLADGLRGNLIGRVIGIAPFVLFAGVRQTEEARS